MASQIAVVGQGVIGCTAALAILERLPNSKVTLFADRKFEETCSYGPAGLFRLDKFETRKWAKSTFDHFASLERELGPSTGIKLVSGHIQSDSKEALEGQEKNYADIVYNFRWLTQREIDSMFVEPSKYCIHYTAYAAEGRRYLPWLQEQLKAKSAKFIHRKLNNLAELGDDFPIVINCAGIEAGKLAGDDDTVFPIRGVAFEVEAPWHKHFNYRDFATFTIPMTNSVILGSVKQPRRSDSEVTDEDRHEIWDRYLKLHPTFKGVKVLSEWCHLRPERKDVRLEQGRGTSANGQSFDIIHCYGHGGNGFTLGWGCALDVAGMVEKLATKSN